MQKNCKHCGSVFIADQDWKTMCIPCYIKWKTAKEPVKQNDSPFIPDDILSRLIRLCHPDRHKNSDASNEATKWLLELRRVQRDNEKGE